MFEKKYRLRLSILLAFLAFLLTRLPFFLFYSIPGFSTDIFFYHLPVIDMVNGHWPVFDIRTPGYPLFLFLTYKLNLSIEGVYLLQMLSGLFVLIAVSRILDSCFNKYYWPAYILLVLFYSTGEYIAFNTFILPLSLFTDLTILGGFLLVAGVITQKRSFLIACSFCLGFLIILRPQGLLLYRW